MDKRKYRTIFKNFLKDACKKVEAPYKEISTYMDFCAKKTRKNIKQSKPSQKNIGFTKLMEKVIAFYLKDENSAPAPGVRDFIKNQTQKTISI